MRWFIEDMEGEGSPEEDFLDSTPPYVPDPDEGWVIEDDQENLLGLIGGRISLG